MPWPRKTSTCRSFVTISSGLCRLLAIVVLLQGQNHTSRWTRSMGVDQLQTDFPALRLLWPQTVERPVADCVVRGPQVLQEVIQVAEMATDRGGREAQADRLAPCFGPFRKPPALVAQLARRKRAQSWAAAPVRNDVIEMLPEGCDMLLG